MNKYLAGGLLLVAGFAGVYKLQKQQEVAQDLKDNVQYRSKIGSAILDNTVYDISKSPRKDVIAIFIILDEDGSRYQTPYQGIKRLKKVGVNDDNIIVYEPQSLYVENSWFDVFNFFDQLTAVAGKEDEIILYLGGHGFYTKEQGSVAGGMPQYRLKDKLDKIKAQKLLIIDSCRSGGFLHISDKTNNTTVITSSKDESISLGNRQVEKYSFLYELFKVLDGDPALTIEQAFAKTVTLYMKKLDFIDKLGISSPGVCSFQGLR